MATSNTNYYPDGYVVIPRPDYEEMIRQIDDMKRQISLLMNRGGETKTTEDNTPKGASMTDIPDAEKSRKTYKKLRQEDIGKIKALHNAGWSASKIADEIGCSQATIYNQLTKG